MASFQLESIIGLDGQPSRDNMADCYHISKSEIIPGPDEENGVKYDVVNIAIIRSMLTP